jgi:hypothetical protein
MLPILRLEIECSRCKTRAVLVASAADNVRARSRRPARVSEVREGGARPQRCSSLHRDRAINGCKILCHYAPPVDMIKLTQEREIAAEPISGCIRMRINEAAN